MNRKRIIILISVMTVILVGLLYFGDTWTTYQIYGTNQPLVSKLDADIGDGVIEISWDNINYNSNTETELTIQSETTHEVFRLNSSKSSYAYTEGEHGVFYTITAQPRKNGEAFGDPVSVQSFFLNYTDLGNLPLVMIDTYSGEDPTNEVVVAPEGLLGATAVNNDYHSGEIKILENGETKLRAIMELRVRGNTSSGFRKKPYKLKLQSAVDLLREDSKYASREWVLIDGVENLNTPIAYELGRICGMEWTPRFQYVNVIVNGDFKGTYLLMESVSADKERIDISANGFIIENDAYWWDADGVYFKSPNLPETMGYTFTYPKKDDLTDARMNEIKALIDAFEALLYAGDENCFLYIDEASFASWVLVHDLFGNWDGGGTNMYIHKSDIYDDSEIKIGPIWDTTGAYEMVGLWSSQHTMDAFYYRQLFQFPYFTELYRQKLDAVDDTLLDELEQVLVDLNEEYGDALEQSWHLNSVRWSHTIELPVEEKIENVMTWFENRLEWIQTECDM